MSSQATSIYTPALRAVPRSAICWLCCLGQLSLPLCALVSYLYSGDDGNSIYCWWLGELGGIIHVNEIAVFGTEFGTQ